MIDLAKSPDGSAPAGPVLPGPGGPEPSGRPAWAGPASAVLLLVVVLALVGWLGFRSGGSGDESKAASAAATPPGAIAAGVYAAEPADISKGGHRGTAVEFQVKRASDGKVTIPYVAAFGMEPTECGGEAKSLEEGSGITFLDDEPTAQRSKAGGAVLGATWEGGIKLDVEQAGSGEVSGTLVFAFADLRPGCTGKVVFRAKQRPKREGRPYYDRVMLAGG